MSSSDQKGKGILLESGTNEVEFLRFRVCGCDYGINVAKVRQMLLLRDQKLTKLPQAPEAVKGVVYFRGKPISVIDLGLVLGLKGPTAEEDKKLLMVAEFNLCVAGFVVDEVLGIARCSWKEFAPIESEMFSESSANVVGTVTIDSTVVMILDVETLLGAILPDAAMDQFAGKFAGEHSQTREQLNIVYCEDSSIVQKVLLKTLKEAGFRNFKVFPTGAEGLEFLKQPNCPKVDVILSDIEMPRMDGLTLCREVRQLPNCKEIPFVFFSSMITEEMNRKCKSVGGDLAFSKPEVDKIVAAIDQLTGTNSPPNAG